ncbi:DUF305 domain-containing protein [Streptomyces sp. NPDC005931]|uniref:DUF305 domain-containing protein n=1 Tax=Streptomyces sp. NPDC005931 TaxID=3364737 RepID=UPI0036CF76A0
MTRKTSTRTLARRAALGVVAATAALALSACGGDGGTQDRAASGDGSSASAEATAGAHNAQDVAFAQGMIPHHRQALEMARMAADRASSAEVKDLARRIEKAQDPEITTMTGWLESWGEDVPAADAGAHGGHGTDHSASGHGGMPGMMSEQEMGALEKATGKDFDAAFLELMVEHHEGAVDMAEVQKTKGRHGPAKDLADAIITAQKAEITEMNELLGKG